MFTPISQHNKLVAPTLPLSSAIDPHYQTELALTTSFSFINQAGRLDSAIDQSLPKNLPPVVKTAVQKFLTTKFSNSTSVSSVAELLYQEKNCANILGQTIESFKIVGSAVPYLLQGMLKDFFRERLQNYPGAADLLCSQACWERLTKPPRDFDMRSVTLNASTLEELSYRLYWPTCHYLPLAEHKNQPAPFSKCIPATDGKYILIGIEQFDYSVCLEVEREYLFEYTNLQIDIKTASITPDASQIEISLSSHGDQGLQALVDRALQRLRVYDPAGIDYRGATAWVSALVRGYIPVEIDSYATLLTTQLAHHHPRGKWGERLASLITRTALAHHIPSPLAKAALALQFELCNAATYQEDFTPGYQGILGKDLWRHLFTEPPLHEPLVDLRVNQQFSGQELAVVLQLGALLNLSLPTAAHTSAYAIELKDMCGHPCIRYTLEQAHYLFIPFDLTRLPLMLEQLSFRSAKADAPSLLEFLTRCYTAPSPSTCTAPILANRCDLASYFPQELLLQYTEQCCQHEEPFFQLVRIILLTTLTTLGNKIAEERLFTQVLPGLLAGKTLLLPWTQTIASALFCYLAPPSQHSTIQGALNQIDAAQKVPLLYLKALSSTCQPHYCQWVLRDTCKLLTNHSTSPLLEEQVWQTASRALKLSNDVHTIQTWLVQLLEAAEDLLLPLQLEDLSWLASCILHHSENNAYRLLPLWNRTLKRILPCPLAHHTLQILLVCCQWRLKACHLPLLVRLSPLGDLCRLHALIESATHIADFYQQVVNTLLVPALEALWQERATAAIQHLCQVIVGGIDAAWLGQPTRSSFWPELLAYCALNSANTADKTHYLHYLCQEQILCGQYAAATENLLTGALEHPHALATALELAHALWHHWQITGRQVYLAWLQQLLIVPLFTTSLLEVLQSARAASMLLPLCQKLIHQPHPHIARQVAMLIDLDTLQPLSRKACRYLQHQLFHASLFPATSKYLLQSGKAAAALADHLVLEKATLASQNGDYAGASKALHTILPHLAFYSSKRVEKTIHRHWQIAILALLEGLFKLQKPPFIVLSAIQKILLTKQCAKLLGASKWSSCLSRWLHQAVNVKDIDCEALLLRLLAAPTPLADDIAIICAQVLVDQMLQRPSFHKQALGYYLTLRRAPFLCKQLIGHASYSSLLEAMLQHFSHDFTAKQWLSLWRTLAEKPIYEQVEKAYASWHINCVAQESDVLSGDLIRCHSHACIALANVQSAHCTSHLDNLPFLLEILQRSTASEHSRAVAHYELIERAAHCQMPPHVVEELYRSLKHIALTPDAALELSLNYLKRTLQQLAHHKNYELIKNVIETYFLTTTAAILPASQLAIYQLLAPYLPIIGDQLREICIAMLLAMQQNHLLKMAALPLHDSLALYHWLLKQQHATTNHPFNFPTRDRLALALLTQLLGDSDWLSQPASVLATEQLLQRLAIHSPFHPQLSKALVALHQLSQIENPTFQLLQIPLITIGVAFSCFWNMPNEENCITALDCFCMHYNASQLSAETSEYIQDSVKISMYLLRENHTKTFNIYSEKLLMYLINNSVGYNVKVYEYCITLLFQLMDMYLPTYQQQHIQIFYTFKMLKMLLSHFTHPLVADIASTKGYISHFYFHRYTLQHEHEPSYDQFLPICQDLLEKPGLYTLEQQYALQMYIGRGKTRPPHLSDQRLHRAIIAAVEMMPSHSRDIHFVLNCVRYLNAFKDDFTTHYNCYLYLLERTFKRPANEQLTAYAELSRLFTFRGHTFGVGYRTSERELAIALQTECFKSLCAVNHASWDNSPQASEITHQGHFASALAHVQKLVREGLLKAEGSASIKRCWSNYVRDFIDPLQKLFESGIKRFPSSEIILQQVASLHDLIAYSPSGVVDASLQRLQQARLHTLPSISYIGNPSEANVNALQLWLDKAIREKDETALTAGLDIFIAFPAYCQAQDTARFAMTCLINLYLKHHDKDVVLYYLYALMDVYPMQIGAATQVKINTIKLSEIIPLYWDSNRQLALHLMLIDQLTRDFGVFTYHKENLPAHIELITSALTLARLLLKLLPDSYSAEKYALGVAFCQVAMSPLAFFDTLINAHLGVLAGAKYAFFTTICLPTYPQLHLNYLFSTIQQKSIDFSAFSPQDKRAAVDASIDELLDRTSWYAFLQAALIITSYLQQVETEAVPPSLLIYFRTRLMTKWNLLLKTQPHINLRNSLNILTWILYHENRVTPPAYHLLAQAWIGSMVDHLDEHLLVKVQDQLTDLSIFTPQLLDLQLKCLALAARHGLYEANYTLYYEHLKKFAAVIFCFDQTSLDAQIYTTIIEKIIAALVPCQTFINFAAHRAGIAVFAAWMTTLLEHKLFSWVDKIMNHQIVSGLYSFHKLKYQQLKQQIVQAKNAAHRLLP